MDIILLIVYESVKIGAMLHVLMDNRQPAKTMAWMLVIYFVPVVGLLFYFFFGRNTRREKMISQRSLNQLTKRSMLGFVEQHNLHIPDEHRLAVDLFVNQNFCLPFKDNRVSIFTDGHSFFSDLLRAVGSARHSIHLDFYIFEDDPLGNLLADVLIDKARQGVEVKVIYDDVGCWRVKRGFFEKMRKEGIEAWPFMPVRFRSFTSKVNYRNHRKIAVVDGCVGYIGGMNVALRYVRGKEGRPWRDTMVKIEGTGVYGLQRAFLVDWYFVDRTLISNRLYYPPMSGGIVNDCVVQVVTGAPVSPFPEIMQGLLGIILRARKYIFIETPYFMPNEPVLTALKTAAVAGVDVRLMVPASTDARFVQWAQQSYLAEVESMGVKVLMYEGAFLHSKIWVVDDSLSSCGSTNVDFRSFENNFEANAFFYDRAVALQFKQVFLDDERNCVPFSSLANKRRRRFLIRLWESVTRLLSPLL
ncbi:MAG: cardiolipin synthase [Prevotellaceae bacterium]|nr:cardiolipin synthase [Prevotellaceae bacterium]